MVIFIFVLLYILCFFVWGGGGGGSCFQIYSLFLIFNSLIGVPWRVFFVFFLLWVYKLLGFRFSIFLSLFLQTFLLCFSFSLTGIPVTLHVCWAVNIYPEVLVSPTSFPTLFSPYASAWIISIHMSSSSRIVCSVASSLQISPEGGFFSDIIFFISSISIWFCSWIISSCFSSCCCFFFKHICHS